MKQKYTSMNTSINSTKLPRIYNLVSKLITKEDKVIDYGCGRYFDSYEIPFSCVGFDPYNRREEKLLNDHYDISLYSNVLNVIMEKDCRIELLNTLKSISNKSYITVYEGDGTGIGKTTKDDCYQLNRKHGEYVEELKEVFGSVKWNSKGFFECVA